MRRGDHHDVPLAGTLAIAFAVGWNLTAVSAGADTLAAAYDSSLSAVGVASGAFWVTFALAQAPAGRLSDAHAPARLYAVAVLGLAAANCGAALLGWLPAALVLRLAAGAFAGVVMVVAAHRIAVLGPRGQGMVGGATAAGSTLAVATVPLADPLFGWRTPYVGAVVLALAGLALAVDRRSVRAAAGPRTDPSLQPAVALALTRAARLDLLRLACALGCCVIASFALGSWAPSFLDAQAGLGAVVAAIAGAAVVGGSIVTRPLGGTLAHGGRAGLVRVSVGAIGLGAALLALDPGAAPAVAALLVIGLCAGLPFAAIVDRIATVFPAAPGRAIGYMGTIGSLIGMAGIVLIGVAVDHDQISAMFAGVAAVAAVALAATWSLLVNGR